MHILVLALALLPAAAMADETDVAGTSPTVSLAGKQCQDANLRNAAPQRKPTKPRKLDEKSPAEAYYTVLRIEDGCDKPMLVREAR